ncbi:MAG: SDR family NAD(P)-dependent oxidoreductase [Chloroflexota bacterium]
MADLNGKVVLVTGASGNIGQGVVRAFAAAGAKLALVDLNKRDCEAVIAQMDTDVDKSRFMPFGADLSVPEAVDRLLQEVTDSLGTIDHAVHTAGGFAMGDPVHAKNISVFDKMMNLNAKLIYIVGGRLGAYMKDNNVQGSISVVLARAGKSGAKNMAAYTASKAAATRLMESMAAELREFRIRVNGVSPSIVDTPPNRDAMSDANFDNWVKPQQIGDLMVFLARNEAMTGANVEISAWV